jgi:hypothetical protein
LRHAEENRTQKVTKDAKTDWVRRRAWRRGRAKRAGDFSESGSEREIVMLQDNGSKFHFINPSGNKTAVQEGLYSAGFKQSSSKPQPRTAQRVASLNRKCRWKTFSNPSSCRIEMASRKP